MDEDEQNRETEIYTDPVSELQSAISEVFRDFVYEGEDEKPVPEIEKIEWDMPPQAEARGGIEVDNIELLKCNRERDDSQRREENTGQISLEIVLLYEFGENMSVSHLPAIVS
jgi:hypothetical protein